MAGPRRRSSGSSDFSVAGGVAATSSLRDGTGELGDSRGARARDHHMRPAQPFGEILDVRRAFGGDAEFGVAGAHRLDIVLAALLNDLQPDRKSTRLNSSN